MLLPSEIESHWLIPATRSIIARELVTRYNFSQDDVAAKLGITQATVSNYLCGNRGNDQIIRKLRSDDKIMEFVHDIAENLSKNYSFTPYSMAKYLELFNYVKRCLLICKIHRSVEDQIDDSLCKTCERFLLN